MDDRPEHGRPVPAARRRIAGWPVCASCVRDGADAVLKRVNPSDGVIRVHVKNSVDRAPVRGKAIVLSGENDAAVDSRRPDERVPVESAFDGGSDFTYPVPARSFIVLRQAESKSVSGPPVLSTVSRIKFVRPRLSRREIAPMSGHEQPGPGVMRGID